MNQKEALQRAVEIVGGQKALAEKLTLATDKTYKQGHVWAWLNRYPIDPHAVIPTETIVEGEVTRHDLRPDLYPAAA